MPSDERILEVERETKNFMQMQYEQNKLFTKTMEEQSAMLKNISHQIASLYRWGKVFWLSCVQVPRCC